jgi:hypothetical protein
MEKYIDFAVVLIEPLVIVTIILLVCLCVLRPLFKYLAISKQISEEMLLKKEYEEHKREVKRKQQEETELKDAMILGKDVES